MGENVKSLALGAAGGLLAALMILAGFIIARANIDGAGPGDWLNFAGVIVGVVLTVGAAKAIDVVNAYAKDQRRKRITHMATQTVAVGFGTLHLAEPDQFLGLTGALPAMWNVASASLNDLPELEFHEQAIIHLCRSNIDADLQPFVEFVGWAHAFPDKTDEIRMRAGLIGRNVYDIMNVIEPWQGKARKPKLKKVAQ
jgi:hypothetical protein